MIGRIGIGSLLFAVLAAGLSASDDGFRNWPQDRAVQILTKSPWAKQETFTSVVGGIGSGLQGEKEIYSTYFVRLLSASPIRQAFARLRQIELDYDRTSPDERNRIDKGLRPGLDADFSRWIVVAVAFRCNNVREQTRVERFFENETAATLRLRAYLSTATHPRVELHSYFPPRDKTVGAKFVFPRKIDGVPIVQPGDGEVVFEFDTPSAGPEMRARFVLSEMMLDGALEL